MVKRCAVEMAKAFGDDNMAKNFETVSLSRRTVTRRIFDIQNHVEGKLREIMNDCKYFSLALDESTDVMDVSQLLIYTRTIDSSFEVPEELLQLVQLGGTLAKWSHSRCNTIKFNYLGSLLMIIHIIGSHQQ